MELPQDRTLHQRMMNHKVAERIEQVHWVRGPAIMALWLQDMYLQFGFGSEAVRLLARERGLDSTERLRVFTVKNVNDIWTVMRKPGNKNADGTPDRGQQISVIAYENLKLAIFLFHYWWKCTFDWEVTGV